MASDSSPSLTPTASKSKQERIRDNQRRSRARRQEYLTDLERRLKECHATCREADLQRTAFVDLQAENARLRDLLNYAGINPEGVDGFGRQLLPYQPAHATRTMHRQIKPKIPPPVAGPSNSTVTMKPCQTSGSCCPTTPTGSSSCPPTSTVLAASSAMYSSQPVIPFPPNPPTNLRIPPGTADTLLTQSYDDTMEPEDKVSLEDIFCCDTFLVPPSGPLMVDEGNTVQCSVAKMVIDQYHPTPNEMEEIKARLSTAFSLPRSSEPGCRVSTEVLFEILYDMNSRETQD